jgi:hypothetical protein
VSTDDTPQIPVDAPQPDERVDIVSPVAEEPEPTYTYGGGDDDAAAAAAGDFTSQHPEALVAGAFAGAFVFAKLLKRIGGG